MTTLAVFNEDGFPVAFYRDDVNDMSLCPPDAVVITEEQWLELINNSGLRKWDGTSVVLFEPPPPTTTVPTSVTPKQARLALSAAGLLSQVNAMVRAADEATQITWDYALTINRTDPLILQLAAALEPPLSEAQIDDLFVKASQIA